MAVQSHHRLAKESEIKEWLQDTDSRSTKPEPPRGGCWIPCTRTPCPKRLSGFSKLSCSPLEKRRLTYLPLPEDGVCRVNRQKGWDSAEGIWGTSRGLTICTQGPSFLWVLNLSLLEISQKQFGGVNKSLKSPLFPIYLPPRVLSHTERGQQPGILPALARPGHQLPGPPKPRSRA